MSRSRTSLLSVATLVSVATLALSACSVAPETSPSASPSASRVDTRVLNGVTIPAPALAGNLVGASPEQSAMVYLPPQYFTSDEPLPVLYYLNGEADTALVGLTIPRDFDRAFETLPPMIFVIVKGGYSFGGSVFFDSDVTGHWSTYLAEDVVGYVDAHFRTISTREARGIAGHSIGGAGALNTAVNHPDVFGSVFALSPCIFAQDGLAASWFFPSEEHIRSVLAVMDEVGGVAPADGLAALAASDVAWDVAYGMAMAPTDALPYFEYPYSVAADGTLVRDDAVWAKWQGGFGGAAAGVETSRDAWASLKGVAIDCGTDDEFAFIPPGCAYLDAQLTETGIAHEYITHAGGHSDRNKEQTLDVLLPFFSEIFAAASD